MVSCTTLFELKTRKPNCKRVKGSDLHFSAVVLGAGYFLQRAGTTGQASSFPRRADRCAAPQCVPSATLASGLTVLATCPHPIPDAGEEAILPPPPTSHQLWVIWLFSTIHTLKCRRPEEGGGRDLSLPSFFFYCLSVPFFPALPRPSFPSLHRRTLK